VLEVQYLGLRPYAEVWELQKSLLARRAEDDIPDQLLLVEHPPVITCGRRFQPQHLLTPATVPVYHVERGGDVSFHEPGQLTGYPIVRIPERNIHQFLRLLEDILIHTLADCGLTTRRHPEPEHTGVWIEDRKIASIGIAVRRWISWHGFALNIHNSLQVAQQINPCGFPATVMTTLQRETQRIWALEEIGARVAHHFQSALHPPD
jgi:lipoyl(octanoyl) transferase